LVQFALNERLTLFFTLALESLKTFEHSLAHLFRRFLIVIELLFVHLILGSEESGELTAAFFEISLVLSSQLFKTALANFFHNSLIGLVFPLSSECKILVTVDL